MPDPLTEVATMKELVKFIAQSLVDNPERLAADHHFPEGEKDLGVGGGGLRVGTNLDGAAEAMGTGNSPQTDEVGTRIQPLTTQ